MNAAQRDSPLLRVLDIGMVLFYGFTEAENNLVTVPTAVCERTVREEEPVIENRELTPATR